MAGNLLQFDADGKLQIQNDKIVVAGASDPCCCAGDTGETPLYIQGRHCPGDALGDLWAPYTDGSDLPFEHKVDNGDSTFSCYKFEAGNPISDTPGTLMGTLVTTTCATDEDCVCQDSECPETSTPCVTCGTPAPPTQFTLTFSGISVVNGCTTYDDGTGPAGSVSLTGLTPNITIVVTNNGGGGCAYEGTVTSDVVTTWYPSSTDCTGDPGTPDCVAPVYDAILTIRTTGTRLFFTVLFQHTDINVPNGHQCFTTLFSGQILVDCCDQSNLVISNAQTTALGYPGTGTGTRGYDGIVTVEAC